MLVYIYEYKTKENQNPLNFYKNVENFKQMIEFANSVKSEFSNPDDIIIRVSLDKDNDIFESHFSFCNKSSIIRSESIWGTLDEDVLNLSYNDIEAMNRYIDSIPYKFPYNVDRESRNTENMVILEELKKN